MPDSLQKIGENAFKDYNMHNITIPDDCKNIDPTAFTNCGNVIVYNKSNLWLNYIFQEENPELFIIDQFDYADESENVDFYSNYERLNYYISKTDDIENISENIIEKLNEVYDSYTNCDNIQDIQIIIDEDIYSIEYAEKIHNNILNNLIELKNFEKLDNVAVCETNKKYQILKEINEITSDEIAPVLHNNSIRICQHHYGYCDVNNEHYIVDYVDSMQDLIDYPNYIYKDGQTLNFTKYGNVEEHKNDFSKLLKTIYNGFDKDYHIHALGFSNFNYSDIEFRNSFNEFSTDEYPYKIFKNIYYNDCNLTHELNKDIINTNELTNDIVKPTVLWFSRHDMTPEQREAIGGDKVNINQINKTINSAYELKDEIEAADIIAIVAPINLQQQFLELANEKPIIMAVNDRVLVPQLDGSEDKVEFKFNKWEQIKEIEIEKDDFDFDKYMNNKNSIKENNIENER